VKKQKKQKSHKFDFTVIIIFTIFALYSFIADYAPGIDIVQNNFWSFLKEMIFALPIMFILVGLFDVWVSKEKVQKHIGEASGIKGILLVLLLGFMQAGPLYAAFPVAYILWKKGTSPINIFIYLSSTSIAKIPMLTFEIGFLGLDFSLLRILISIPIFIIISIIIGKYFDRHGYKIKDI